MNRIILLNGPPRSGKDCIASLLVEHHGFTHLKFADPLRETVFEQFDITEADYETWKASYIGNGKTGRDFMIAWSECIMKPLYGIDYYGAECAKRASQLLETEHRLVISDCGFRCEVDAFIQGLTLDAQIELWQIHRPSLERRTWRTLWRKPNPFRHDSRGYVETRLCPTSQFYNDSTLEALEKKVAFYVQYSVTGSAAPLFGECGSVRV